MACQYPSLLAALCLLFAAGEQLSGAAAQNAFTVVCCLLLVFIMNFQKVFRALFAKIAAETATSSKVVIAIAVAVAVTVAVAVVVLLILA